MPDVILTHSGATKRVGQAVAEQLIADGSATLAPPPKSKSKPEVVDNGSDA